MHNDKQFISFQSITVTYHSTINAPKISLDCSRNDADKISKLRLITTIGIYRPIDPRIWMYDATWGEGLSFGTTLPMYAVCKTNAIKL